MKNPNIAKMLRHYRKCNRLSVNEVAERLEQISPIPVAAKTIYGWESGQTQPDADMLLRLCKIYKIDDILKAFGYVTEEERFYLTSAEKELIVQYRKHAELQTPINMLLGITPAPVPVKDNLVRQTTAKNEGKQQNET